MATEIALTQGQVALVDEDDGPWVEQFKWSAALVQRDKFVAVRQGEVGPGLRRNIYLSRALLGLGYGDPLQADHRNHDTLDNRRSNLRVVTPASNKENQPSRGGSSRFVGVTWDRDRGLWRAQIQWRGRVVNLGRFVREMEAAEARDLFVVEHGTAHALNLGAVS